MQVHIFDKVETPVTLLPQTTCGANESDGDSGDVHCPWQWWPGGDDIDDDECGGDDDKYGGDDDSEGDVCGGDGSDDDDNKLFWTALFWESSMAIAITLHDNENFCQNKMSMPNGDYDYIHSCTVAVV